MTSRQPHVAERAALVAEAWTTYRKVRRLLPHGDVGGIVASLTSLPPAHAARDVDPQWLGRMIWRRLPQAQAVCIDRALVQMAMLHRRGVSSRLVIGLPKVATSKEAHAWVEVDGVDVGPPPGGRGHTALARYP